jgi:hypothetical protein
MIFVNEEETIAVADTLEELKYKYGADRVNRGSVYRNNGLVVFSDGREEIKIYEQLVWKAKKMLLPESEFVYHNTTKPKQVMISGEHKHALVCGLDP